MKFLKDYGMRKILLALAVVLVTMIVGCNNQDKDNALKDPIILNLVEQSFYHPYYGNGASTDFLPYWIHHGNPNWNLCSSISRTFYCKACPPFDLNKMGAGPYTGFCDSSCDKPISCDAIDLRLKNLGFTQLSSATLVSYYLTVINNELKQINAAKEVNNKIEQDLTQKIHQKRIENMANGKQ